MLVFYHLDKSLFGAFSTEEEQDFPLTDRRLLTQDWTKQRMAKTEFGAKNIFNITQPQDYRCQVWHYHAKLSRLYVRVFKGTQDAPVFFLLFTDVGYMECPMSWQGAEFNIGSQDECIQLMLDAGLIGQAILRFPNAYASITEYARLFRVTLANREVQLIANSATMLNQMPDI